MPSILANLAGTFDTRTRSIADAARQRAAQYRPISSDQARRMSPYTSIWGNIFGSYAFSSYYSVGGQTFAVLFYLSLTAFIVFLLLVFIHYTMYPILSFSPNDGGIIPIPTISDRELSYSKAPAAFDVSANFVNLPGSNYTLGADIYLTGDFMLANIPRVVLYRAIKPVTTGGTGSTLLTTYPETNFIVWLDSVKNDLYISIITQKNGGNNHIQTSEPIENVPVRKVFRLAVVFTPNFVEIYINGKMERSMVIDGTIVTIQEKTLIYSSVKPIQQNVMLANLSMWPRVLTAREINVSESSPIKDSLFFSKAIKKT